jgi:hypothetical protein
MELDDLKTIWKSSEGFRPKNEAELTRMLQGHSKSIIYKLKRNVWFEMIFTLLSGAMLLAYTLTLPSGALKWVAMSILIVFSIYTLYYAKKLVLLSTFEIGAENIKTNLEKLIRNLTGYLRFYKRSYTILYPLYFILSLILIAIEQGASGFIDNISKPKTILVLFTLAAVFYFCCTWLVDWLLKRLYGNHLDKMKALLNDIDPSAEIELR